MNKDDLSRPPEAGSAWTRIDLYLRSLHRRRSPLRRGRSARPAHQPEPPPLLLGTLPFLLLIAALAVLAGAIFLIARPGAMREAQPAERVPPRELGTAPPGWFEDAKKEFR